MGRQVRRYTHAHVPRAADAFARQLYLSMLAQALIVKSAVEVQRSQNTFGTLLWQLNEMCVVLRSSAKKSPPHIFLPAQLAHWRLGLHRVRRI